MQCPQCQTENLPDSRFCEECGARLDPACRRAAPVTRRRRASAGSAAARSAARRVPPRRRPPTRRSISPRRSSPRAAALEGERKQVTVLFADVKGSMELAEQLDPEEWHTIMDRFFAILADGVHRFEGTVNQYTGDGIMALFGAPIAHEDHAQRACYAALHLRDELRALRRRAAPRARASASRCAWASTPARSSSARSATTCAWTTPRRATRSAWRAHGAARRAGHVLPHRAHGARSSTGYFALRRPRRRSRSRASREPVRVYELAGRRAAAHAPRRLARARLLALRRPRRARWRLLEAALERALGGQRRRSSASSPSRASARAASASSSLERCRARGIARLRGARRRRTAKTIPFLPILELLRGYFGITEQDSDRGRARARSPGALLLLDETLRATRCRSCSTSSACPIRERPAPRMDPGGAAAPALRRRAPARCSARSRREPAVHRCSRTCTGSTAAARRSSSTLVEARARHAHAAAAELPPRVPRRLDAASRTTSSSPLLPLGAEAIARAAARSARQPTRRSPASRERIRERTGGNPFFIEEVVQSLVEAGALAGTTRRVSAGRAGRASSAMPADRAGGARGAHRPAAGAREAGAADGGGDRQGVRRAGARGASSELAATDELRRRARARSTAAEFVYEQALYPEAEYAFKHPLTQEVAYRSQLAERRARVHAAVARAIEELYAEKLDERAALLAHHWEGAGRAAAGGALAPARRGVGRRQRSRRGATALAEGARAAARVSPNPRRRAALGLAACIALLKLGWRLGTRRGGSGRALRRRQGARRPGPRRPRRRAAGERARRRPGGRRRPRARPRPQPRGAAARRAHRRRGPEARAPESARADASQHRAPPRGADVRRRGARGSRRGTRPAASSCSATIRTPTSCGFAGSSSPSSVASRRPPRTSTAPSSWPASAATRSW